MPVNPPHSSPFTGNASFGGSKGSGKSERRGKSGASGSGTPSSSRPRKAHDRTHDRPPPVTGAVSYDEEYHAHATGQRNFAMESRAFLQPTAFGEFEDEDGFAGQFMDDGDAFAGNSALLRNAQPPGGLQPNAFWKVSYSRAVAASRFYRNQALISEVLNETCVPDVRSVVTTQRLHVLRKQVASLEAHQLKLEAELSQLTEKHDAKKRRVVESFSTLRSDYARSCADRQRFVTLCDPKSDSFRVLVERYKAEYSKAVPADPAAPAQASEGAQSPRPDAKKDSGSEPTAAESDSATPAASEDAKPAAEQSARSEPDAAAASSSEQPAEPAEREAPQTATDQKAAADA